MRSSYSIRFITEHEQDRTLLKSVLATFGHRPTVDWHYQKEGSVDVALLDIDTCSSFDLEFAHNISKTIIFYTTDMSLAAQKALVLHKPAHARDFLLVLDKAAGYLASRQQQEATVSQPVVSKAAKPAPAISMVEGEEAAALYSM
jgi:hypothetical protein